MKAVYIVMDYYEYDVRSLLSTDSFAFTEEHVIILAYNLLCALKFIHSANLMHRDIKPGNILVTPRCTIKLCDFGLGRTITDVKDEEFE